MNLQEEWNKYAEWFSVNMPTEYKKLNPPATEQDFRSFEDTAKFQFPQDMQSLYSLANGSNEGTLFGLDFLPISRVIEQWQSWAEVRNEGLELGEFSTSFPENFIKKQYSNPKWIPILYDWSGNHIGVDLDPDTQGTRGQVINFGRDEDDKFVIASDLTGFIHLMNKLINEEQIEVITAGATEEFNIIGSHHLIDGLRTLLVPGNS